MNRTSSTGTTEEPWTGSTSEQAVAFTLLEQRLAADAEDFRGAADLVVHLIERGFDRLAFQILERLQRACKVRTSRRLQNMRKILRSKHRSLRKYQRAF